MKITDLKPICEMLKVNKSIEYLDLEDNLIEDLSPLINVVLNNKTLKKINLENNYWNYSDIKKLKEINPLLIIEF